MVGYLLEICKAKPQLVIQFTKKLDLLGFCDLQGDRSWEGQCSFQEKNKLIFGSQDT